MDKKNNLKHLLASFFAQKLTPQVKELYSSTLILNFAISAVSIFEPVFLYLLFIEKYGLSKTLQLIMLFYLGVYVVYFFIIPFGAKFSRRFGYEHAIAFSTIFTALFYFSLFIAERNNVWLFFSVIVYVFWKALYWPAYHSDFAHFSVDGEQGRQISNLLVLQSLVFILGPLAGGVVLKFFGFNILFLLASALMILSNIPMLITKERFEPASFSYVDSYKRLFAKENRRKFFSLIGFGEELIAVTIWPIFIYVVINDFLGLGILTSVSILITTTVFLYIGRAVDNRAKSGVYKYGVIFYFFGWLFRLITRSTMAVFLTDSFSRVSKQAIIIPITASTYRRAQDTSVMKTILFFEMSLIVGKIIAMVLALILLQFFVPGWNAMFLLAALMTPLYLLFKA